MPVVDRNRCEGNGPCVDACRYDVLAMGPLGRPERSSLSSVGRIKAFAHGNCRDFVVAADASFACGDCARACSEHAITLARRENTLTAGPTTDGRLP